MNRLTIGQRLFASYAIAISMFGLVCSLAYSSVNELIQNAGWVAHTHRVLETTERIASTLKDAETGQRGFLITGQERYLEPYTAAVGTIKATLEEVRGLTADNPRQQERIEQLAPLVAEKLDELAQTVEIRRKEGFEAAQTVVVGDRGKRSMDQIRAVLTGIERDERKLLDERDAAAAESSNRVLQLILALALISTLVVGGLGFAIARGVTGAIGTAVGKLSSVTTSLLAATAQQSASASQTASSVSETVSTLAELRQTAELALQKARLVSEVGQRSLATSRDALQAVSQGMSAMRRIREEVEGIAGNILELSEKHLQISEIVQSVGLIAEQSNLLAVNAAIEAADAGDHGRRFSVVAAEVKSLADQSKAATGQIRSILADIQKASNAAVMVTEQGTKRVAEGAEVIEELGRVIESLSHSIGDSSDAGTQITATSAQQASGVEQISSAMRSVEEASRQVAQGAQNVEQGARSIDHVGKQLRALVGQRVEEAA